MLEKNPHCENCGENTERLYEITRQRTKLVCLDCLTRMGLRKNPRGTIVKKIYPIR